MASKVWQLQEAKNHFSEVVELAMTKGAQTVTKRGKPAVVIVSAHEYERIRRPTKSIIDALRECPSDLARIIPLRGKEPAHAISKP